MRPFAATAISFCMLAPVAQSQTAIKPEMIRVIRRSSQPPQPAPAENFTGSVQIDSPFQANAPARTYGARVTFEAGARTAWHTHVLGQILIVTAGTGRVQRWGDPVEEIRQGDIVWIPPGQKHWHGAAPNTAMTHIGIVEQLDGKSTDWMEKVTDAQYAAPVAAQLLRRLTPRAQLQSRTSRFVRAGRMPSPRLAWPMKSSRETRPEAAIEETTRDK